MFPLTSEKDYSKYDDESRNGHLRYICAYCKSMTHTVNVKRMRHTDSSILFIVVCSQKIYPILNGCVI